MSYEVIALDLDGTLTNDKKEIPPATKEALFALMEEGKKVILVSGRPVCGVMPVAKELKFDQLGGYVMGYNAGQVVECKTMKILQNYVLPDEVIEPIFNIVEEYPDVCLTSYKDNKIIINNKSNQYVEVEAYSNKMPIVVCEDFLNELERPLNKLLVCGPPQYIPEILGRIGEQFGDILNLFPSEPFFGEVMPKGIDKGYSLGVLVKNLGYQSNQVIACGDSGNDIPMIEYAGLGVAMDNALPEVKKAADYITRSNQEEGVLHVINQFMR